MKPFRPQSSRTNSKMEMEDRIVGVRKAVKHD